MSLLLATLRRFGRAALVLTGVVLFNFLLLHAAGGDAADVLAGESGAADAAYVEALRHRYGLDQPLPVQFALYVGRVVQGDLGTSFRNATPVLDLIGQRLPATLLLSVSALVLSVCAGMALGMLAARRVNSWVDGLVSALATLGYAMPLFWTGLMLVVLFAVKLGWLPSGGYEDVGGNRTGLARMADILRHLALPAVTLALFTTALAARIMRASMIETLRADYVRTARGRRDRRAPGRLAGRPAERGAAAGHDRRAAGRLVARRDRAGGNRVRLARPGPPRVRSRHGARPQPAAGLAAVQLGRRRRRQHAGRRGLCIDRPAAAHRMRLLRRFCRRRASVLGAVLLAAVLLMAAGADWLYPGDPWDMAAPPLLWPGEDPGFPLGSDTLGRDIAAGLFHGARASLLIGSVAAFAALTAGVAVGAAAGWYGGRVDAVLMRVTELVQAMPPFLFAVVLIAALGPRLRTTVLALAAISWPTVVRLMRGEVMRLRQREFVEACVGLGMTDLRIVVRHVLPNALPPVIVMASVIVASAILTEAGLSFLGLGDPDVLSWGTMIGLGRDTLRTSPYMAAIPGVAILATVLGLNLVSEGLNDALLPGGER